VNVPQVRSTEFIPRYRALNDAVAKGLVASVHGVYRGGLGVHLALVAMGGNLGMHVDLRKIPAEAVRRNDVLLFSESAGRFIVTIDPRRQSEFEAAFSGVLCACIGKVTAEPLLRVDGLTGETLMSLAVSDLKAAWKMPFGSLI
jgi:phosphoribosylformylglycinamidine synthase